MSEMDVRASAIEGLVVISMKTGAPDPRGLVREFFRASSWRDANLPSLGPWQQVNVTESAAGAVRGLHGEAMTKLVAIVAGEAFGAYVDTRPTSPTFGSVATVDLRPGVEVLVPRGVCNGYQSVTDTQYLYCFDEEWRPGMAGVAVNALDPALAIDWPVPVDPTNRGQLSEKDAALPSFGEATGGQTAER